MPPPDTLLTTLKPHQRRVVERIAGQPGLVVAHGLGSGKTLSSIAAGESLGGNTSVLVPAALQANYQKELQKHLAANHKAKFNVRSLQSAALSGLVPDSDLLVVDEAHRLRDPGSSSYEAVQNANTAKRLLLTGTPLYNSPADLGSLVNLASGEHLLPSDKQGFENEFVNRTEVDPGFLARWLKGIKPGERVNLTNTKKLKSVLDKWVDYQENDTEGFPQRIDEIVDATMSPEQHALYQQAMSAAPSWVDYKLKHNLPPSKQESKDLNAFLGAVRQISVSPGGFNTKLTPLQAAQQSPKIQKAFQKLQEGIAGNPAHKALVYSNYLDSGIAPYEALLQENKIPYGKFTGEVSRAERDKTVQDYNAGLLKALLVSSAGGEGLDLKGTREIQLLDPHWNREKLEQVVGRGIRYGSHAGLPKDQQNVHVEKYRSLDEEPNAFWKMLGYERPGAVDEYLEEISKEKDKLNEQVRGILRGRKPQEKSSMMRKEAFKRGFFETLVKAGQANGAHAQSLAGQSPPDFSGTSMFGAGARGEVNPLDRQGGGSVDPLASQNMPPAEDTWTSTSPNPASFKTQDVQVPPAPPMYSPKAMQTIDWSGLGRTTAPPGSEQGSQARPAPPAKPSLSQQTIPAVQWGNSSVSRTSASSTMQVPPPDYASQIFGTQNQLREEGSHADRLALTATLNNLKTKFMSQPGANALSYNRALNTGRA